MSRATDSSAAGGLLSSIWSEAFVSRPFLLDLFVLLNLAFLILDVYLAHSFNDFAHWAEWIPVYFSIAGTIALGLALFLDDRRRHRDAEWLAYGVAWTAILVGLAGLVWHLEGWFFESVTLRSLVYSAPFVAPLSFAGLGCLLLINRIEDPAEPAWGQWVVFLALGGFVGNFGLSVIDHAQNAFFYASEWIPVVVSALGVGVLAAVVLRRPTVEIIHVGFFILALQVVTGLVGLGLHLAPLLEPGATETGLWDSLRYGPPVFAPLLFVDLAVLAALGLWDLQVKVVNEREPVA